MGNSKGRDNVKKRASRNRKTERLALAKAGLGQPAATAAAHPAPEASLAPAGGTPRPA